VSEKKAETPKSIDAKPAGVDPLRELLAADSSEQLSRAITSPLSDLQPGTIVGAARERAYKVIDTTASEADVRATRSLLASRGWRPLTGPYAPASEVAEYVVGMPTAELWWMPAAAAKAIRDAELERTRMNPLHRAVRESRQITRTL